MDSFIPDVYQKSIYTIDYKKLKKDGIKCLLFDLDNTLVPINEHKPSFKLKELINKLKDMGFKIIIFSNATKKRIMPFKQELEIDCSYNSLKPLRIKYITIIKKLGYSEAEIAAIGDQLITDILGGNRVGIKTILINPVSKNELLPTKINRLLEKIIIKILHRKGLFKTGKYYD